MNKLPVIGDFEEESGFASLEAKRLIECVKGYDPHVDEALLNRAFFLK